MAEGDFCSARIARDRSLILKEWGVPVRSLARLFTCRAGLHKVSLLPCYKATGSKPTSSIPVGATDFPTYVRLSWEASHRSAAVTHATAHLSTISCCSPIIRLDQTACRNANRAASCSIVQSAAAAVSRSTLLLSSSHRSDMSYRPSRKLTPSPLLVRYAHDGSENEGRVM